MLIKQKEIEARRKILENPVKLKKLHELLKKDKISKDVPKKSKEKKSRKKRSSSSSSVSDEDLDELLMKKYSALQGKTSKQDQSSDESNFIDKKFQALKKELDKFAKKKKKSRHRRRSSTSSSSPKRSRDRRSRSKERNYRSSRDKARMRSRESRDTNIKHQSDRNPSPPAKQSYSSRKRQSRSHSSDEEDRKKKQFGLVTASGEKISLKSKADVKWYTKDQLKHKAPRAESKNEERNKKRPALSEAEKEEKRREMMENASWRERDRSTAVKKSRINDEKELIDHTKEFDKDFLNRHLKKAQNHPGSIESRIRSNLNNIQRSSRTMDTNFARR